MFARLGFLFGAGPVEALGRAEAPGFGVTMLAR